MGWIEAIKAAIISLPKIIDLMSGIVARIDSLVTAMQERHEQEKRNDQHFAAIETLKLQVDADRAEMAKRLSILEQRH